MLPQERIVGICGKKESCNVYGFLKSSCTWKTAHGTLMAFCGKHADGARRQKYAKLYGKYASLYNSQFA